MTTFECKLLLPYYISHMWNFHKMGISFIDTIVVRRSLNKGTTTTDKPKTVDFKGHHISTGKGTGRIKI